MLYSEVISNTDTLKVESLEAAGVKSYDERKKRVSFSNFDHQNKLDTEDLKYDKKPLLKNKDSYNNYLQVIKRF